MLLRNIDQSFGLCDTRLIVTQLRVEEDCFDDFQIELEESIVVCILGRF